MSRLTSSSLEAEVILLRLEADALAKRNAELRRRFELCCGIDAISEGWGSVAASTPAEEWVAPEPHAPRQHDATTQTASPSADQHIDASAGVAGLPSSSSREASLTGDTTAGSSSLQYVLAGIHHLTLQVLFLAAELIPASSADLLQALREPQQSENAGRSTRHPGDAETMLSAKALREHTAAVERLEAALRAKLCALSIVAKESDEALASHVSTCSPRIAELEELCRTLRADVEKKDASLMEVRRALERTTTMMLQAHETIAEKERIEHELRKAIRDLADAQEGGSRERDELRRENASLNLALSRVQQQWLSTTGELNVFGQSEEANAALPEEAFPSPTAGGAHKGGTPHATEERRCRTATESVGNTLSRSVVKDPSTARRTFSHSIDSVSMEAARRRDDILPVTSPPPRIPIDVKLDALTRSIFERAMNVLA